MWLHFFDSLKKDVVPRILLFILAGELVSAGGVCEEQSGQSLDDCVLAEGLTFEIRSFASNLWTDGTLSGAVTAKLVVECVPLEDQVTPATPAVARSEATTTLYVRAFNDTLE